MPGNVIDIQSGDWVGKMSGLGAGLDSFYEYLLKVKNNLLLLSFLIFLVLLFRILDKKVVGKIEEQEIQIHIIHFKIYELIAFIYSMSLTNQTLVWFGEIK